MQKQHITFKRATRATFATRLLRQGKSLYLIQQLLGHASVETTIKYLYVNEDEMREAVNDLG